MSYRLHYWRLRGRGEQIRLLLNEIGADYEDVYVDQATDFPRLKEEGAGTLAFGSVPMLEDGAFKLVQGPVIMNYLGRRHGMMPSDPQAAAKVESMVLGAEDMRMAYFRLLGKDERRKAKRASFPNSEWKTRWLPAWNGLLELNGDSGFLLGDTPTPADIAAWDALDGIVTYIDGATFDGFSRVAEFYDGIAARPSIAAYLGSDRRIGKKDV